MLLHLHTCIVVAAFTCNVDAQPRHLSSYKYELVRVAIATWDQEIAILLILPTIQQSSNDITVNVQFS